MQNIYTGDAGTTCISSDAVNTLPGFMASSAQGTLLSKASLSKCSPLHSSSCGLAGWNDTFTCANILTNWLSANINVSASGPLLTAAWGDVGVSAYVLLSWIDKRTSENSAYCFQAKLNSLIGSQLCTFSSTISYGSSCGLSSSSSSICWNLTVSTGTAPKATCSSAQDSTSCGKPSLSVLVFESIDTSNNVAVSWSF